MSAKFAYAQWPWGTQSREEFVTSCREIREAGYDAFESVKAFIDTFKRDPADFAAICREFGIKPVSFYFHLSGNVAADIADLKDKIGFVEDNGITTICVQAAGSRLPATVDQLKETVEGIAAFADICLPRGITPCVHPHYETLVMRENEIDYVMEHTDPARVGFAPDTAHLVAGGCDPYAIIKRYVGRVKFAHLKDIRGALKGGGMQDGVPVYENFRELGEGDIDFSPIFALLKEAKFDGYLCVELDRSRFTNMESARMSLRYLKENWSRA